MIISNKVSLITIYSLTVNSSLCVLCSSYVWKTPLIKKLIRVWYFDHVFVCIARTLTCSCFWHLHDQDFPRKFYMKTTQKVLDQRPMIQFQMVLEFLMLEFLKFHCIMSIVYYILHGTMWWFVVTRLVRWFFSKHFVSPQMQTTSTPPSVAKKKKAL